MPKNKRYSWRKRLTIRLKAWWAEFVEDQIVMDDPWDDPPARLSVNLHDKERGTDERG